MHHCLGWLTPNGLMYLDVPYRRGSSILTMRAYNESDLQRRLLQDWREVDREVFPSGHPDGPYLALVLRA